MEVALKRTSGTLYQITIDDKLQLDFGSAIPELPAGIVEVLEKHLIDWRIIDAQSKKDHVQSESDRRGSEQTHG